MVHAKGRFWDKIAASYDKSVNKKYSEAYRETIAKSRKYLGNEKIAFDFACGTGITSIELAKDLKSMIATDISGKMIELAKQKAMQNKVRNIDFLLADIHDPAFNGKQFDVLMAFNVILFISDLDEAFQRISELLTPGGIFLSATDCLGEKNTYRTMMNALLSSLGIIPPLTKFKTSTLKEIIQKNGFEILEAESLYQSPPNLFIAAKKV